MAYALIWFAAPGASGKLEGWRRRRGTASNEKLVFPDGRNAWGQRNDSGGYAAATIAGLKNALSIWCVGAPRARKPVAATRRGGGARVVRGRATATPGALER